MTCAFLIQFQFYCMSVARSVSYLVSCIMASTANTCDDDIHVSQRKNPAFMPAQQGNSCPGVTLPLQRQAEVEITWELLSIFTHKLHLFGHHDRALIV